MFEYDGHFAVVRPCLEVDPAFFRAGSSTLSKARFVQALEAELARFTDAYFFNVESDDPAWRRVVEGWGARPVFQKPNWRYRRDLPGRRRPKES